MFAFRRLLPAIALALVYTMAAQSDVLATPRGSTETHSPAVPRLDALATPELSTSTYSFVVSKVEGQVFAVPRGFDVKSITFKWSRENSSVPVAPSGSTDDNSAIAARFCDPTVNADQCQKFSEALKPLTSGDGISIGDTIYTGDESGAVLQLQNQDKLGNISINFPKILLAQDTALNIEDTGASRRQINRLDSAISSIIQLRLDAGLLATVQETESSRPTLKLPTFGDGKVPLTLQIALTNASPTDAQSSSDPRLQLSSKPMLGYQGGKWFLPAVIVGHDPQSGDVSVSVLDGTASFVSGDQTLEIPAEKAYSTHIYYCTKPAVPIGPIVCSDPKANQLATAQVEPMTDQDWAVWVSALRFGGGDPLQHPTLKSHVTDGEPEPFPVFALVHSTEGQDPTGHPTGSGHTHIEVHHTGSHTHAQAESTHSAVDGHTDVTHSNDGAVHDATHAIATERPH